MLLKTLKNKISKLKFFKVKLDFKKLKPCKLQNGTFFIGVFYLLKFGNC